MEAAVTAIQTALTTAGDNVELVGAAMLGFVAVGIGIKWFLGFLIK